MSKKWSLNTHIKRKEHAFRKALNGFLKGDLFLKSGLSKTEGKKIFKENFKKAWPKWQADPKGMFEKFAPKNK